MSIITHEYASSVYVYGAPSNDSDVDLLVILDTDARPADRYLSVSRLIRPRPFPVDILVKTPAEVEQALKKGDVFIVEIVNKGRVLYNGNSPQLTG